MLINKKQVKAYVKGRGKKMGKQAMDALELYLRVGIDKAITNSNKFKTIQDRDVFAGTKK